MCVILIADEKRPTAEMVERAHKANDQGFGIGWREDRGQGLEVCWKKGLYIKLEDMQRMCAELPTPYVAHFRIASVGGIRGSLCHPFPVDRRVPEYLEGRTKGHVLFHNGHWSQWDDVMLRTSLRLPPKERIPLGRWSDSRAMAFYASIYGVGALDFLHEKIVAFSPDECEVFGTGWSWEEGVLVSNRGFLTKATHYYGGGSRYAQSICRAVGCLRRDTDAYGWCPDHDTALKRTTGGKIIDVSTGKESTVHGLTTPRKALPAAEGGDRAPLPFDKARLMWLADQLSNKKFKGSCRAAGIDYQVMRQQKEEMLDRLTAPLRIKH